MASTQEEQEIKAKNKKYSQEIERATKEWLDKNKKILDAQVEFLKKVKEKRGDLGSKTTNNIKETFIKNLSEFLKR